MNNPDPTREIAKRLGIRYAQLLQNIRYYDIPNFQLDEFYDTLLLLTGDRRSRTWLIPVVVVVAAAALVTVSIFLHIHL